MNIVFIVAFDNSHGRIILSELVQNGMSPVVVFMGSHEFHRKYRKKSILRYLRQKGWLNLLWRLFHRTINLRDVKKTTRKISNNATLSILEICKSNEINVHFFDNINSNETAKSIEEFKPELIVLGGAPLLKKRLLKLPSIGVLNAHPGILPQARGMDVVAHSILEDIPHGITVFKLDEGMDTGSIIIKEFLVSRTATHSLQEIEAKVEALAGKAMVKAIKIIEKGTVNFVRQRRDEGNSFKAIGYKEYCLAKRKLRQKV